MNTPSKTLRSLGLAVIAGASLIQAAQAAPPSYGPRNTVRFEPLAPAHASCPTRTGYAFDGSTKQRHSVAVPVCNDSSLTRVKRWIGPRNTIPIVG